MIPPRANKFSGRCSGCGVGVAPGAGFLTGRDATTGYWKVSCPKCVKVEVAGPEEPDQRPGSDRMDEARRVAEARRRILEKEARARDARHARMREEARLLDELIARLIREAGLGPTSGSVPECLAVLGLKPPVTADQINSKFRELALASHPDHGGYAARFIAIKKARDQALALVGASR